MKKLIAIFVLIAWVISVVPVIGADITTITLDATENNDAVVLTASISDNAGVAGYNFEIQYNTKELKPVSVNKGDIIKTCTLITNVGQSGNVPETVTACIISPANITANGELFSIEFERISGTDAEFKLIYKDSDFANEKLENVEIKVVNNTIKEKPDNTLSGGTTFKPVKKPPVKEEPPKEEVKPVKISFTDVKESDWFYDAVLWGVENSLTDGVTATEFAPEDSVTRAMLVTMLHRYSGDKGSYAGKPFSDINKDEWYYSAVMWAHKNKLVNGMGNGEFAPEDVVTREQTAKIIYEYAKLISRDIEVKSNKLDYADSYKVSDWAIKPLIWAAENKIITGMEDNTVVPDGEATRAEIITILKRFLNERE